MYCADYRIIGRYMDGSTVHGYQLTRLSTGESRAVSREQVIDMAVNNMIENAKAVKSNGTVSLRGIGCDLTELPVKHMNKGNKPTIGSNGPGIYLDKYIMNGDTEVGFVVKHTNGATKNLTYSHALQLLQNDKIKNAKISAADGKYTVTDLQGNELNLDRVQAKDLGINVENSAIKVDNGNIKDSRIRKFGGIHTANGEVKSIPVHDNITKSEYKEHKDWIDNMVEMLRESFVDNNLDTESGFDGRFTNPEIRVTSDPGSSRPIVSLKFNIYYLGLKESDAPMTFCRMSFSEEHNKGVAAVRIPEFADVGKMITTKYASTADERGINELWGKLMQRMLKLKFMGFDNTVTSGEQTKGIVQSMLGVFGG